MTIENDYRYFETEKIRKHSFFRKTTKIFLQNQYMQVTELYAIINNNIQLKICFVAGNTYIWRKICLISPHGEKLFVAGK